MRYDLRDSPDDVSGARGLGRDDQSAGQRRSEHREQSSEVRQPLVPIEHLALPDGREQEAVRTRDRTYRLRGPQTQTLAILGTFRVVDALDVAHYGKDAHSMELDLRSLKRQELVTSHSFYLMSGERLQILTLTERGRLLLERAQRGEPKQYYRAGQTDLSNIRHDAALYRMYQQEAGRLEQAGARILRVISEEEIGQAYQRHLSDRAYGQVDAQRARQEARAEFAESWHLPVVRDRLQVPDLRVEYETAGGERRHVDLELVTERYSREQVRTKLSNGFVVYRPSGSSPRGGVPDGRLDPERLLS